MLPKKSGKWIFVLAFFISPVLATTLEKNIETSDYKKTRKHVAENSILKNSQISYRATGDGPGVQSFGVIISCVDGKISILKSLRDPDINHSLPQIRQIGNISQKEYLNLWRNLEELKFWNMDDAKDPTDLGTHHFTTEFFVKLDQKMHKFKVKDLDRPEFSSYLTIQKLIDKTANMQTLWDSYHSLASK